MQWCVFLRHLMAPVGPFLLGSVTGIGLTLCGLGWLTRWHAAQLTDPPPVTPEAWDSLGGLFLTGGLIFLVPVIVVGAVWLIDGLRWLAGPASVRS